MKRGWKVLAKQKWVSGAVITESFNTNQETVDQTIRRFTATVRGKRGFVIYEGDPRLIDINQIIARVQLIKQAIDAGYEDVLTEKVRIEPGEVDEFIHHLQDLVPYLGVPKEHIIEQFVLTNRIQIRKRLGFSFTNQSGYNVLMENITLGGDFLKES